jgi:3-hydroxypropanoate dehydrogenase
VADTLSSEALDLIFREARSYNGWLDKPVSDEQIHAIYELLKMAPTSANMQPARIVWVKSAAAKEKLAALAMDGNKDKITSAPVVAIIGYDIDFHEELPRAGSTVTRKAARKARSAIPRCRALT